MIQTILILLLIHYIGLYTLKPKNNTLNCGIFGWAGKDPKKFNKDKFDKLGILNVERGKSSCGVSFDGDIQIGVDSNKFYYDFIVDRKIKPERFPIVIGHTRQSSVGAVNVYNAHPFGFGDNGGDFIFIGAHNGTLKNHKELAKKYEIEESVENSYYDKFDKEIIINRDKIDSELLLEIIYRHKNFKVLSEYIGGAALVFTDTTNPNVLYLFKGKSKDWPTSTHESTERPMYVYVENINSMYFSSLEEALRTIGGNNDNIIDIESNVVYKITNGNFKKAELINITRINSTQNLTVSYNNRNYNNYHHFEEWGDEYENNKHYNTALLGVKKTEKEEISSKLITLPLLTKEKEDQKENNIYNEKTLKSQDDYRSIPYFNKLRWYRNGQLINGIYVWINEYGYFYVGSTKKTAEDRFYQIIDKVFDGKIFYDEDSFNNGKVPFDSSILTAPSFFYFVEGVQIKTYLDYSHFCEKYKYLKIGMYLDYVMLSQVSTHPIINLNYKSKDLLDQNILKNGVIFTGNTTVLGAEKIYHIKKGNLESITINNYFSNFKKDYFNVTKLIDPKIEELKVSQENNFLNSLDSFPNSVIFEQNDDDLINDMIEQEEEINEIIRDICEEDFTEPIKDFQQIRNKLFKYSDNDLSIKVISFIDNTMRDIKNFIN